MATTNQARARPKSRMYTQTDKDAYSEKHVDRRVEGWGLMTSQTTVPRLVSSRD